MATPDETPPDDAPPDGAAAAPDAGERSYASLAAGAAPAWASLRWEGDRPALDALDDAAGAAAAAREPWRFVTVADAGAWWGRPGDPAYCRSFVALAGRAVALCEFVTGAPLEAPAGRDGPHWRALLAALRGLAGPQRLDVQVLRAVECPAPLAPEHDDGRAWVFLPDMHLPVAPPMPELPRDLVPDPTKATCFCHGPVMARILGGAPGAEPRYVAVGATLSRDPNEWFYLMVERYREVAEDLVRFLNRFQRCAPATRAHLVQLGGLFEVWAGFDVTFHATGRAGQVIPKVLRGSHLRAFETRWRDVLKDTPTRDAVARVARLPEALRTLLHDDPEYMARGTPATEGAVERPSLAAPGLFRAEHHHPLVPRDRDLPPVGLMALREQAARVLPWQRNLPDDFRTHLTAWAVESLLADATGAPAGAYVAAHTHVPFLANVRW